MSTTPGKTFYDRQIELLEAGNVEELIRSQYAPDATLISFDVTRRGHDELIAHFRDYLQHLGSLKVLSTDKFTETDDSIFFEATAQTAYGIAHVYDIFMLRDGVATHHFTGLLSFEPNATPSGS
ncbi:hypothetical protein BH23DEI1_BH23DEI1_08090 [soil metagenome]